MATRWGLAVVLMSTTSCALTAPAIVSTSRTGCEVVVYNRNDEAAAEQLARAFCQGKVERAGTGYYQWVWNGDSHSAPTMKFDCAEGSTPDVTVPVPTRVSVAAKKGNIGDQCTSDDACERGLTCRAYSADRPARCIAVATATASP